MAEKGKIWGVWGKSPHLLKRRPSLTSFDDCCPVVADQFLSAHHETPGHLASPLLDAALQFPKLAVGKESGVLSLQLSEQIFRTQVWTCVELLQNRGPHLRKRIEACPPRPPRLGGV